MTDLSDRLAKASEVSLAAAEEAQALCRKAFEEVARLQARNAELESMATDDNVGLWRFWNAKARDLSAELADARKQLNLAQHTEEAAVAMIGLDKPAAWKQAYVMETYGQEYLDLIRRDAAAQAVDEYRRQSTP
jgi:hypothetical protein